ncbi:hypothetical protein [Pannonibacter tanglangensis]|uniref:Uncharacterized protein n=1 Tax=Pannonibacter tanglangensis TaxID=2750084 RepID=A0ABW9ZB71_9HYPH|nr:hypothetical protein [Pannonibacter sp. XCT-34]NBN62074.1 hypothetical protein [Pannonibacter sp. XCT-34]
MIDPTKKYRTKGGLPVKGLRFNHYGAVVVGFVDVGDGRWLEIKWNPLTGEAPGSLCFGLGTGADQFDLVPVEDKPALPDLDARLYLIGCAISGTIASADADINPDPRLTAKWAVEFADEVLAMLAEQKDGAA